MSGVGAIRENFLTSPARGLMTAVAAVGMGGSAGSLAYAGLGITCPFRAMGLACPGCGCGTAVRLLFSEGVRETFAAEPTAMLVISVLAMAAVSGAGLLMSAVPRRVHLWWSRSGWSLLAVTASANVMFQMLHR